MELVKKAKVYCPQCGRKRGVHLWKDEICVNVRTFLFGRIIKEGVETQSTYYITCDHCGVRWQIINLGVWSKEWKK
mgnify:CR=1 FL=1